MRQAIWRSTLLPTLTAAALSLASCRQRSEPAWAPSAPQTAPALPAEVPVSAPTPPSSPAPETPRVDRRSPSEVAACLKSCAVTAHSLAVTWPSRIGQQVYLETEVVRALDFAQLLVHSDAEKFLVMATPGNVWDGRKFKLFSVVGAATGKIAHGPQRLPQLMLLDDEACVIKDSAGSP